jgi:hypothetical protein
MPMATPIPMATIPPSRMKPRKLFLQVQIVKSPVEKTGLFY